MSRTCFRVGLVFTFAFFSLGVSQAAKPERSSTASVQTEGTARQNTAMQNRSTQMPAATSFASFVYWTEGQSIRRSSISNPSAETLISGPYYPQGIHANVLCQEQLFWTDNIHGKLFRADLDGAGAQELNMNNDQPLGVAAHPASGKVYWSDWGQDRIYRANFDFSNTVQIASFSNVFKMGNVRIAGDKLYWTLQECLPWPQPQTCDRAVFQRSDLDGTNLETLFVLESHIVVDFFVDASNGRLYWTTRPPATLVRGNLDGSGIQVLQNLTDTYAHLAQEPGTGRIIWSDGPAGGPWRIMIGDQEGSNSSILLDNLSAPPWGISVVLNPPPLVDCNQNGLEDDCELNLQDCQHNGIPDSCDIESSTSADCDLNGVPDECDPDCQANGVPDACDIESATSQDCNGNLSPDECELFGNDCNLNGVPDACDLASGTSTDCVANGVPDECELAGHDCNDNDIHDACDILSGFSQDENEDGWPDECIFVPPDAPMADATGISKCRFISFVPPGGAGNSEPRALRVGMVSLHNVVPPYSGAPTIPFDLFEGQAVWVGPYSSYRESSASQVYFNAAATQCTPHYQDWSTVGLLHVMGAHIVPSSTYEVQQVLLHCQGQESNCSFVSAPLEIRTTRWSDVAPDYNPPSTNAQPDVNDIAAMVLKFRSGPNAAGKARLLIAGNDANGNFNVGTITNDFNFSHIAACVDAFRGGAYPYKMGKCATGPGVCSTNSECTGASAPPCNLYCP